MSYEEAFSKGEYQRNPSFYGHHYHPQEAGVPHQAPVYAQQHLYSPVPTNVIQVQQAHPQYQQAYIAPLYPDPDLYDERLPCARFGCMFSWIPLVGLITFLLNMSAPIGSQRRRLAWTSLLIAVIVATFNIGVVGVIYWALVANTESN